MKKTFRQTRTIETWSGFKYEGYLLRIQMIIHNNN